MVKHILKDGTITDDISGHLVKKTDTPVAYELIDQMNAQREVANEKDRFDVKTR